MSSTPFDIAVFIGRLQPLHNGHLALLQRALGTASHVVVVLGSAHQARTPKNPFTWQERADMVRLALSPAERDRVTFLPLRDYYDEARWVGAVQRGVAQIAQAQCGGVPPRVALVGHFKDATSAYLERFEGWSLVSVERASPVDAVHVRNALLGSTGHDLDATLLALDSVVPRSTLDFVRAWTALPFFAAIAEEWAMLRQYQAAWAQAPYAPVFVTVDAVLQCAGHVLLIRRGHAPGLGLYAVPGGFIEQRETVYQSAIRELREETCLDVPEALLRQSLRQTAVFDHPDRSLRGRTITHAHYFDLGAQALPAVQAADDAAAVAWVPVAELAALEDQFFDDHFHMLEHFLGFPVV